MTQIDQNLLAALYVLGFNFLGGDLFSGEIAEIKGDMTVKLVHPTRRGVKIRRRVAGWEANNLQCRPTSNRQLGRALAMTRFGLR